MRILLNGRGGKVGTVLAPALEAAGHELVEGLEGADAMVDFTAPEAALGNVQAAIAAGVPSVVGTSGWDADAVRDAPVADDDVFVADPHENPVEPSVWVSRNAMQKPENKENDITSLFQQFSQMAG